MSTPPALKRNGKGKRLTCPHAPECETVQTAADALGMIDARFTRVEESMGRLHTEALDFRRAVLESHEEILTELRRIAPREEM